MEHFHPLDRLIGDSSLSLLEALVPFVDYPYKRMLVLFIKYKEIKAIMASFNNANYIRECGFDCHPKTTDDFLSDICKLLPSQYAGNLQNMKQMMQVMQMMDRNTENCPYTNALRKSDIMSTKNNGDLFNSVMNILNDDLN